MAENNPVETTTTPLKEVPKTEKDIKVDKLREAIEAERKKRFEHIIGIKKRRRRLDYKTAELETLTKAAATAPKNVRIGKLRRMKEALEFRISTESHSLTGEKEIIRKLNEIEAELNEAIAVFKAKRKLTLITGDIELLKKEIEQEDAVITESNKLMDNLYDELRALTRTREHREYKGDRGGHGGASRGGKKRQDFPEPESMNISLKDIAVIKKRNVKEKDSESSS